MLGINVSGNNNISNTGNVAGNYTIINFPQLELFKLCKTCIKNNIDNMQNEQSLLNMTEAQKTLALAINKFAEAELIRAEADKLRAKADENNSEANLNYSRIMLEDRELMKQLMDKIK